MEKRREKAEVVREKRPEQDFGCGICVSWAGKAKAAVYSHTVFLCKILNPRLEGTVQVLNP